MRLLHKKNVEKIEDTITYLDEKEKSGKKLTKEEVIYKYYLYEAMINPNPTYIVNNQYYKLNEIKEKISSIEGGNKINTYEHKNLKYVYNKIKNLEEPKFYFKYGWNTTTNFDTIAVLISILIAVGLAPMFSDEYQSNSAHIVLSCKRGKEKLVLSKIIAGLIFTSIVFVIINIIYFMSALRYDFIGWDKPLELFKYYRSTMFDMSVIDFYLTGLGISFIGSILFSLVVMLVSLIVKNNMISLLLILGMYYMPTFLANFIPIETLSKVVNEINFAEVIRVEGMFIQPNTYNILGSPVSYLSVLISLVILSTPVLVYLIKYFGKRQAI